VTVVVSEHMHLMICLEYCDVCDFHFASKLLLDDFENVTHYHGSCFCLLAE